MTADASTATQILRTAEALLRTRGYNAFSYADIAKVVGVSTASIHYHFPSKSELVRDLVALYTQTIKDRLESIVIENVGMRARLSAYVSLFRESIGDADRMCACVMLGAEAGTVPDDVRETVGAFFHFHGDWVARVLSDGRASGEIDFVGPAAIEARMFCATVQGAALIARGCGDIGLYDSTTQRLLATLERAASCNDSSAI